jgi:hypothetical protein
MNNMSEIRHRQRRCPDITFDHSEFRHNGPIWASPNDAMWISRQEGDCSAKP